MILKSEDLFKNSTEVSKTPKNGIYFMWQLWQLELTFYWVWKTKIYQFRATGRSQRKVKLHFSLVEHFSVNFS